MEKILAKLFDYQHFEGNKENDEMAKEARKQFDSLLTEEQLANVSAAGDLLNQESENIKRSEHTT